MTENEIGKVVVDAALKVHRELGARHWPGASKTERPTMYLLVPFCILLLLTVSCRHAKPSASWAGSRQNERLVLMRTFPHMSPELARRIYPYVDEASVRASWPSTLDEAVTKLISDMDVEEKTMVRDFEEKDLIRFHLGWGTAIRNDFGLRRGNSSLMRSCHSEDPDDASMVIIKATWERLQKDGGHT